MFHPAQPGSWFPKDPFGALLLATIVALIAALLVTYQPPSAIAHDPNPVACQIAWERAEVGGKWRALKMCQAVQRTHKLVHACAPPRPFIPARVTVKGSTASLHQRRMLTRALAEARRRHAPKSHMVALVAGMTQESAAENLAYGDRDSVGILQLRAMHEPDGVGIDWRMRPENSAGWFLDGAHSIDPRGRARLATTRAGWGLIQRVQRSGHPELYDQWIPEARRTVGAYLGACHR